MQLQWDQMRLRFNWGHGLLWHPSASLDRDWFRNNLNDYDLLYVWHGAGYIRDEAGQTTTLRPGVCLFLRPGSLFEIWQEVGARFGTRFFHFDLFDPHGQPIDPLHFTDLPLACEVSDLSYFQTLTRRLADLVANEPVVFGAEAAHDVRQTIETLLKVMLNEFVLASRIKEQHQRRGVVQNQFDLVSAAVSKISEDPEHFDLAEFASAHGYTIDHFRRMFKRVVGRTPHQLVIATRIDQAKYLLRNSTLTISEVAKHVGYANVHYLSLQFKRVVGMPPSEYRAQHHHT